MAPSEESTARTMHTNKDDGIPFKRSASEIVRTTPWTPSSVHQRSHSNEEVPSLLSEDVDEFHEQFMTLSPRPATFFDDGDKKLSPSLSRKRLFPSESEKGGRRRMFDLSGEARRFLPREEPFHDTHGAASMPSLNNAQEDLSDIDALVSEQALLLSKCSRQRRKQWPAPAKKSNHESSFPVLPNKSKQSRDAEAVPQPFTDDAFVKEQEELMAQILRERKEQATAKVAQDDTAAADDNTKVSGDASRDDLCKEKVKEEPQPVGIGIPTNKNRCVELYPGRHVKILDRSHAHAALATGSATIFQCAGCDKKLLAGKDTKLLFCSGCGTLTPTSLSGGLKRA